MEFYDVVGRVLDLLQRQGRVSYRALKRQFGIDDDYIEDLKEEIIEAQRLAVDENGRILVWVGDGQTEREPMATPAAQTAPAAPRPAPTAPEAERRQLTVMFCDLVDSTRLSGQLDPEDLREVIKAYQAACTDVITQFDGHVAQLLGDGLLVYFGYPQAHEDDAQRAIRTGLGILDAISTLNARLRADQDIELAVRLGIHTGLVVVGEMGAEGRQEQLALGETPNIAARLQGMAEPNAIVISDATHRLSLGFFDVEALGEHELRGVSQPIALYRVQRDRGAQSRLDLAAARGLTPLVGREQEVGLLLERWEQTQSGHGQVVLLSGEAGIGKSRLVRVLKDQAAQGPHVRMECRSLPYFANSALYPIMDFLQRILRFQTDDTPEQKLEKLAQNLSQYRLPLDESVPLFASLLSLPLPEDRYPPLRFSPQLQRQKTLEAFVSITFELTERQPVLFILEDLHWTDPTTLELLELLIAQTSTAALYVLATCRPEFQPAWSHRSYLTEVTVNRLSSHQVARLAEQVAGGKRLPDAIAQQLVDKTDGVPLYVEEMIKAVLESGMLKDVGGEYELSGPISTLAIPATLQDSLMARLDRLATAKAVAQYASVIGRQFSYELLQIVSGLDEATLQRELGRLVEAELVHQRGVIPQATYIFKHALVQDTAYQSLLRGARQDYHRRIAEVLEEHFPEIQPELLARHFTAAGLNEQAVEYWRQAGQQAVERSAHVEAISHIQNGLALLQNLPLSEARTQQELDLQIALGPALMATKGWAASDVEDVYTRARELCQQVGHAPQLFPVLRGLWNFYNVKAEFQTSYALAEQLLSLAQRQQEPTSLLGAHRALGADLYWMGEFTKARRHLEQVLALYDPQHHHTLAYLYWTDPGIHCLAYMGLILWLLGYPEQAMQTSGKALSMAQERSHTFTLSIALYFSIWLLSFCRDIPRIQEQVESLIVFATEQGFPIWLAGGTILQGWGFALQGDEEEGLAQLRQGMQAYQATGVAQKRPYYLSLLAEGYSKVGQTEEGLHMLTKAQDQVNETGERRYEAEIHRLKGQLLLQQSPDNTAEAASCFQQAIAIAQNQSAKSWELRAATSLARLWQRQEKRAAARELLEPVYNWFTEGFDTADLIDAKALLEELS